MNELLSNPKEFCCGISHELMKDPVIAQDGHGYDRRRAEALFTERRSCQIASPVTGEPLRKLAPWQATRVTMCAW